MGASGIRVLVLSGADTLIGEQRRDLRRRGRVAVWAMAPALGVIVIAQIVRLTRSTSEGLPLVVIVVLSLAILGAITASFLWIQKRRSSKYPGSLWYSRLGFYPGPYDDQGGGSGLQGSAAFAERHKGDGVAPVVRLVLTVDAVAIVPSRGPNQPMLVPLAQLSCVTLVHGDRKTRGIRLTTSEGRLATFLVKPDNALANCLQRLGAIVEYQ